MASSGPGVSPIRLARALWRYRGQIEAHGDEYQAELATMLRTTIVSTAYGRLGLSAYRFAMRAMIAGIAALALFALVAAVSLWQLSPWAALLALLPAAGAWLVFVWRASWGAPLDWLAEHADPNRSVTAQDLPSRLHALALETRSIANVPGRLADQLDALASEAEHETG